MTNYYSGQEWRRSSRCDASACVEVAQAEDGVAVRDNTLPTVHLTFDSNSWRTLLANVRSGEISR